MQYERIYGETCSRLPGDIINFQHDPLAAVLIIRFLRTNGLAMLRMMNQHVQEMSS